MHQVKNKSTLDFVKEMYRRNSQNMLLDLRNPLGLPIKAPNLEYTVNFKDKFVVEFVCKFGNVPIPYFRSI